MAAKHENRGSPSLALVAIGAILVIGLVWYFGVRSPKAFGEHPAIEERIVDYAPTAIPTAAVASTSDTPPLPPENPELAATAAAQSFTQPRCGDYSCDAAERCDTCPQDCGCAGGEYCNHLNGICYDLGSEQGG
jgi:hypothetical protein